MENVKVETFSKWKYRTSQHLILSFVQSSKEAKCVYIESMRFREPQTRLEKKKEEESIQLKISTVTFFAPSNKEDRRLFNIGVPQLSGHLGKAHIPLAIHLTPSKKG